MLLSDKLLSGMTCIEFRKAVHDLGWQPRSDEQCLANVVGGNYKKLCSTHPDLASCRACAEVPELSACSGDGHCQVHFAQESTGAVLEANTYGPISDWNAPGERSRLTVTEWQVDAKPAYPAAMRLETNPEGRCSPQCSQDMRPPHGAMKMAEQ